MAVALEPGAMIAGRYRLDRLIGDGGMGIVWAATEISSGATFAIKHLRADAAGDDETRKRFLREAQATSAIAHPNIVGVHDFVRTPDGLPAIVMDLLDGEPLSARLQREGSLSLADTAAILLPVVSAVGTAHSLGIVHRDLKPDNIFLSRSSEGETSVKVLDFGIAKLTNPSPDANASSVITGTWALLGTPYYMSPEQIIGERDIDHRSDIWALGVILYECLAGVRPAEAKTPGKIFELILLKGIRPLAELAPTVPYDVTSLVTRMLSRERVDRPADLREVERVLARHTTVRSPSFDKPSDARLSLSGGPISRPRGEERPASNVDPLATTSPEVRLSAIPEPPATLPAPSIIPEPPSTLPAPSLVPASVKPAATKPAPTKPAPANPAPAEVRKEQRETLGFPASPALAPPAAIAATTRAPAAPSRYRGWTGVFVVAASLGAGVGVGAWMIARRFVVKPPPTDPTNAASAQPAPGGTGESRGNTTAMDAARCPQGMAFISGGAFLMGSNEGKDDEQPVHRVEVKPYCLDRTEVTAGAYTTCVRESACSPAATTVSWNGISDQAKELESTFCVGQQADRTSHPVNCVDWGQADAFCQSRGKRLPSEEEWEFAARGGGEQRKFPWGDAVLGSKLANLCGHECREMLKKRGRELPAVPGSILSDIDDGSPVTSDVGSYAAGDSREGVHDLTGSVWEWTSSAYCAYPSHSCSNPARVFRGGGWATYVPTSARPTSRLYSHPTHRYMDIGFRCAAQPK